MKRFKRMIIMLCLLTFFGAVFLFVSYESQSSVGKSKEPSTIVIEKGENFMDVAKELKKKNIISKAFYFNYYIWTNDYSNRIVAGEYEIMPNMKIPEIVQILIKGETRPAHIKITFPEGWTAQQMAERLDENNLPGEDFLAISSSPSQEIISKYDFFQGMSTKASLEGFLFPDTYFFAPDASAQDIILKMLKNFDDKFSKDIREQASSKGKTFFEILTMASIIEGEVRIEKDRGLVSGLFWKRLEIGMPLQSDATVSYALGGKKKIQHNANDINIDSPYNTYKYKGLPPGPVLNPGIASITAAINPVGSDYVYFLNNPKTGETFFSETFEEHVQKKSANGL